MSKRKSAGVIAVASLLMAPVAAAADVGHVDDERDPGLPPYADLFAFRLFHKQSKVAATLRLPVSSKRKLAKARMHIQRKGARRTWTVAISRNRRGEVTAKRLYWTLPGESTTHRVKCKPIRAGHGIESVYISAPRRCFSWHTSKPIRAKAQIVARGHGHMLTDSTRYTEYLDRGRGGRG